MKATSLIISIAVMATLIALISISMFNISQDYGVIYDNETMASLNKMEHLTNQTNELQNDITQLKESGNFLSKIDAFFSAGYDVLKTFGTTAEIGVDVGQNAIDNLPLEAESGLLVKNLIWIIIIVLVVVGIILTAVIKREL